MIEQAFVFDNRGRVIHWHDPIGASGGSLPDSRELWDVLWGDRKRLGGVAHSHPWEGPAVPSNTDVTTFAAIEKGLGSQLTWPVVTLDNMSPYVRNRLTGDYVRAVPLWWTTPHWVESIEELRRRSRRQQGG